MATPLESIDAADQTLTHIEEIRKLADALDMSQQSRLAFRLLLDDTHHAAYTAMLLAYAKYHR